MEESLLRRKERRKRSGHVPIKTVRKKHTSYLFYSGLLTKYSIVLSLEWEIPKERRSEQAVWQFGLRISSTKVDGAFAMW